MCIWQKDVGKGVAPLLQSPAISCNLLQSPSIFLHLFLPYAHTATNSTIHQHPLQFINKICRIVQEMNQNLRVFSQPLQKPRRIVQEMQQKGAYGKNLQQKTIAPSLKSLKFT